MTHAQERIRIDKWLWHARFCKTRGLASEMVQAGRVRVNGQRIDKPGRAVGEGDVLTFAFGDHPRVLRILACGARRGPASEAQALYVEIGETRVSPEDAAGEQPS